MCCVCVCVCVWLSQVGVIVFATPNTLANSYTHTYIHTYYLLVYATVIIIKWPSNTERDGVTERERERERERVCVWEKCKKHKSMGMMLMRSMGYLKHFCVSLGIYVCLYLYIYICMYVCTFCKENMCFSHVIITKGLVFMS